MKCNDIFTVFSFLFKHVLITLFAHGNHTIHTITGPVSYTHLAETWPLERKKKNLQNSAIVWQNGNKETDVTDKRGYAIWLTCQTDMLDLPV